MPLGDVDVEAIDSALAVNLRGVFVAMKHELPAMVAAGSGAIVNMSSTAGLQAVGGLAAYVATKHGLEGLTKVAALDYAQAGVRVNALAPGPILTDNLRRAGAEGAAGRGDRDPDAPHRPPRRRERRRRLAVLRRRRVRHRRHARHRRRQARR
jgi:NAD(P)-dependent dehydrogenase (short-subunit alcohol dehydrogenase family)